MEVAYFRPRRAGPEALIENTVAAHMPNLFSSDGYLLWMAGALPIGAGMPDLVAVSCDPQVTVLAQVEISTTQILAYLRAVGCARLDTIIARTGMRREITIRCLDNLVEIEAVSRDHNTYALLPAWREILPEIITIEVKVKNWKRAVRQAVRNRIFAHRSFVALPNRVAQRIRSEPVFRLFGIGLLSVSDNDDVMILRRSRRRKPRVWTYYYQIASLVARHYKDSDNAVHNTNGSRSG